MKRFELSCTTQEENTYHTDSALQLAVSLSYLAGYRLRFRRSVCVLMTCKQRSVAYGGSEYMHRDGVV